MLALTCAAIVLRSSGSASRIAALGRMSKLNETVHPGTVRLEFVGPVEGERLARVGHGETHIGTVLEFRSIRCPRTMRPSGTGYGACYQIMSVAGWNKKHAGGI